MKIIFRLNYSTVEGQSIWLKYSAVLDDKGVRFDQIVPLTWLNPGQWETTVNVRGAGRFRIEYNYQLRGWDGVELDEWDWPRNADVDLTNHDALLLLDTWRSAGTVDYAFETKALEAILPPRGPFEKPPVPANANHTFQLRMAAVPPGQVPCLLGNHPAIGNWGWFSAVQLQETAPNVWQKRVFLPDDWNVEYKYGLFDTRVGCVVSMENGDNRSLPPRSVADRQWTKAEDECYRRGNAGLYRGAGVAIPVFSLRGEKSLGIGEFADLKPLGDWARNAGLRMIQILPINDTTSSHDWTDSYPYSAISAFALHPIYLRIDALTYKLPKGLEKDLKKSRTHLESLAQIDYEAVATTKSWFTRQIFDAHKDAIARDSALREFIKAQDAWVIPYAVFCVKRDHYATADFSQWEEWAVFDSKKANELAASDGAESADILYHCWLQYELDRQLSDAVKHLHDLGLALKGDLPIGIDRQSVDAWTSPHLFRMDAQAGAPPDAFAVKGQNWGFPTYNWEAMKLDDYAWWRSRFAQLSHYFDAYRIDHILGFFRIWQVPYEQVEGIMGHFDPATPIHLDEIRKRGIKFDYNRFCRPYIRWDAVVERFGDAADYVKTNFLHDNEDGYFQLRENVLTQRRIVGYFEEHPHDEFVRTGLLDCVSEVLFLEVPGSGGLHFHPRCSMQSTHSFRDLDPETRYRLEELYNDYFYRRQEALWESRGFEILPALRKASSMLLCGEDLGMVPACVPGVLNGLGILSLEIQRMPKVSGIEFFEPQHVPYMSVVSPSTHDMAGLREWWREDPRLTARFARQNFGIPSPEADLSGEVAARIISQHLQLPAMWAIFPLQDLLAMDESIRLADPEAERINVPAIHPFYWRYRMHLTLDQLNAAKGFNGRLARLIQASGR